MALPEQHWKGDGAALGDYPEILHPMLLKPRSAARLLRNDAVRLAARDAEDPERCALRLAALFALTAIEGPRPSVDDRMSSAMLLTMAIETTRETLLKKRSHRGDFREKVPLTQFLDLTARYPTADPVNMAEATRLDRLYDESKPGSPLNLTMTRFRITTAAQLAGFRAELKVLIESP